MKLKCDTIAIVVALKKKKKVHTITKVCQL